LVKLSSLLTLFEHKLAITRKGELLNFTSLYAQKILVLLQRGRWLFSWVSL